MDLPSNSQILFSYQQLQERFDELAKEITKDYKGKNLHCICLLSGGVFFFTDITRKLDLPLTMSFLKTSSYGVGTSSTGNVQIQGDFCDNLEDKHVIIFDDICDSGHTLSKIKDLIRSKNPLSLKTCTMLDKKVRREVTCDVDYVAFDIDNYFVFGFGLDLNEYRMRNLPFIAYLKDDKFFI